MYTRDFLQAKSIYDVRKILRFVGGVPGKKSKGEIIEDILSIQDSSIAPERSPRGRRPLELKDRERVDATDFDGVPLNSDEVSRELDGELIFGDSTTSTDRTESSVEGVLELCSDGYGFLRAKNYETSNKDAFVSRPTVKQYGLKMGDYVAGASVKLRETGAAALRFVYSVNGRGVSSTDRAEDRVKFEDLEVAYPSARYTLEGRGGDLTARVIDLFCPIGKGQRGLVVAPPKTGATEVLKSAARSIRTNYPNVKLITLLVDERPEDAAEIKRIADGEVAYSTFDDAPERRIKVAELVLNRAKRLVEEGEDVVLLLDSITKLTKAYAELPDLKEVGSGGMVDRSAIFAAKKFFGSARNVSGGGSLAIIAIATVESGRSADDAIYEELKDAANMELCLSKSLSERRIFPSIDIAASGTNREERLLTEDERECSYRCKRLVADGETGVKDILNSMKEFDDNAAFIDGFLKDSD